MTDLIGLWYRHQSSDILPTHPDGSYVISELNISECAWNKFINWLKEELIPLKVKSITMTDEVKYDLIDRGLYEILFDLTNTLNIPYITICENYEQIFVRDEKILLPLFELYKPVIRSKSLAIIIMCYHRFYWIPDNALSCPYNIALLDIANMNGMTIIVTNINSAKKLNDQFKGITFTTKPLPSE